MVKSTWSLLRDMIDSMSQKDLQKVEGVNKQSRLGSFKVSEVTAVSPRTLAVGTMFRY